MSAKWAAQEPAREAWDERRGNHWQVNVLDEKGRLVCVVYADSESAAMARALRIERRDLSTLPTAHTRGAEAMREAAAQVLDDAPSNLMLGNGTYSTLCGHLAAHIRAFPLPQVARDGETNHG